MKNILLLVLVIALTFVSAYGDRDAQLATSEYDHHVEDEDAFAFLDVGEDVEAEDEAELEAHVAEYAQDETAPATVVTPAAPSTATSPVVTTNSTAILMAKLNQYRDAALKLGIDVTGGVEQLKDGTFVAKGANNVVVTVFAPGANPTNPTGCYNNATVVNGVCFCTPKFGGKYCGELSHESASSQLVFDVNANLTANIAKMESRIFDFGVALKKPAVEDLIKQVVEKEGKRVILENTMRAFRQALSINDIYNAKIQLGIVESINARAFKLLTRELALHEDKLESSLVKPGIRQFVNPVMQTHRYEFIDTKKVPVVMGATLKTTEDLIVDADKKRIAFNMKYADSV